VALARAEGSSVTAWVEEMLRERLAGAGVAVPAVPVRPAAAVPEPPAVLVRFADFRRLRSAGVGVVAAAGRLGVSVRTARKYEAERLRESPGGAPGGRGGRSGGRLPVASSAAHGVPQAAFAAPPDGGAG